jgi:GTP cyclohydrolase I
MENTNNKEEGNKLNQIEESLYYNEQKGKQLVKLYKQVIDLIDPEPAREGLQDTPFRLSKSIQFLTHGYDLDPFEILNSAIFREEYKQMVVVKDIEIFSLCEHHLLPFFGKAHVAYIPDGFVTGLSKIARVVEAYSRRLQLQERMTVEIRNCIQQTLKPVGVAVVMEAQHMCMTMRGVQKQNSVTTTSAFTGEFMNNQATREEFFHIIGTKLH